jgi:hypothetical protein
VSRPWAARLYRGTRRLLERALGPARVERWAERVPYKHLTYCLVTWTTRVPEEVERKLQTSGFLLRDGTAADIDALEGERLYDDCATYRAWLAEGQQLLVAEEAGRVVSYVWLDLARSIALENLPEYQVEIGPGAAYGHEAWTLPSHRGRSLRRLTYVAEVLAARRAGKQWLVAYQLKEETLDAMLVNLARTGIPRGDVIDVVHVVQGGGFRVTWHQRPRRPHEAARFVSTSRRR